MLEFQCQTSGKKNHKVCVCVGGGGGGNCLSQLFINRANT